MGSNEKAARRSSWAGFSENHSIMSFKNGQHCWSAGSRTMTVTARCGATSELLSVSEPSTCQYAAVFATPAACRPRAVL